MQEKSKEKKKINKKEILRTLKYAAFAISAGVIQMATFELFQFAASYQANYWWLTYLSSLILSVLWNFTFNRKYTFQSANNVPLAMLKVFGYYCVFTPFSVCFGQWYLVDKLGWNGTVIEIVMMIINFITEFLFQRFFVFGKSIDTNKQAQKEKGSEEPSDK